MRSEKIELLIYKPGDIDNDIRSIRRSINYSSISFNSSYSNLSSTFSITLSKPDNQITPGDIVHGFVSDSGGSNPLFIGIVERINITYSNSSYDMIISGRDITGFLVSTYNTGSTDYSGRTVKEIVDALYIPAINNLSEYAGFPFQSFLDIKYWPESVADTVVPDFKTDRFDTINTIFLKIINSIGYEMVSYPSYYPISIVFGNQYSWMESNRTRGATNLPFYPNSPTVQRSIRKRPTLNLKIGDTGNVISGSSSYDISNRFSEYRVIGQISKKDGWGEETVNFSKSAYDRSAKEDFSIYRVRNIQFNEGGVPAEKQAIAARERARRDSIQHTYVTSELTSSLSRAWSIGTPVQIEDEPLALSTSAVIYKVKYLFDESQGSRVELSLGPKYERAVNA